MARRLRMQYAGGIYHVTFRGNAQQEIFVDDSDRERLTHRVAESAHDFGVKVYLYCWMANHGHMLLETPSANLSAFMSSVLTGYAVYFNRRHGRVGHLMQGRFHSQVVSGDEYLLRLSRYIHLNPVQVEPWKSRPRSERVRHLRVYRWSSYGGYAGMRSPEEWICRASVLALVSGGSPTAQAYRGYVEAGLADEDEVFAQELRTAGLAVGPAVFQRQMSLEHEKLARRKKSREDVSFRAVRHAENVEAVFLQVCEELGVQAADVRRKRRDGTARGVVALALLRRCLMTERAVALFLGLGSGSAVSYLVRTVKHRAERDDTLAGLVDRLTDRQVNSHLQG